MRRQKTCLLDLSADLARLQDHYTLDDLDL